MCDRNTKSATELSDQCRYFLHPTYKALTRTLFCGVFCIHRCPAKMVLVRYMIGVHVQQTLLGQRKVLVHSWDLETTPPRSGGYWMLNTSSGG